MDSSTMNHSSSGQQSAAKNYNIINCPAEQLTAEIGSLHIFQCTNSVRLDSSQVPTTSDGLLGGCCLPDNDTSATAPPAANNIPIVNSVYGSLFRGPTSTLPGVHAGSKTFASKELQDAFMKIYRGDFFMQWTEKGNDQDDEEKQTLDVVVSLHDDDANDDDEDEGEEATVSSSSSRLFRGALVGITVTVSSTGECSFMMCRIPSPSGKRFHEGLTLNQVDALVNRILHIFLRSQGARTTETICRALINSLRFAYTQKRYWKEGVDLAMIAADIDITMSPCRDKYIFGDLEHLGAALGSAGRFHEAATLHEEIACKKSFSKYPFKTIHDQARLYDIAGYSWMLVENFNNAERMFVFALHHTLAGSGGSWALTDSRTKQAFRSMTLVYSRWKAKTRRDGGAIESDATVEAALHALALSVGIEYQKEYDNVDFLSILKPKYMQKKVAQKVLAKACGLPVSVDKFRQTILECVKSNCMIRCQVPAAASIADQRRVHKEHAREEVSTSIRIGDQRRIMYCSNTDCGTANDEAKFLFCPCHIVGYCQKDCQRAHWKEHKKQCPKHQQRTSS